MHLNISPRLKLAATVLSWIVLSSTTLSTSVNAQTQISETREFQIPAGNLDQVLTRFGLDAGLDLYLDSSLSKNQTSDGLQGSYTPLNALQQLLTNTGLIAIQQGDGAYKIAKKTDLVKKGTSGITYLDRIVVKENGAIYTSDEQGYSDVYDQDISTSYIGKTEVERYKGTTPSDLLQGMPGIFSGEARNSGAIDLNIRGIQGPGRVPVAIDGTEQAIVVWRGYNGATNRSYIDPNLVSNVQIYKGAGAVRDVNTGIGGAMVVNTLSVDDVIKPGEDFGIELKVEGSSNAVKERIPTLHTGEDYRDVEGYPNNNGVDDETLIVEPDGDSGGINVLSGEDYAYRLAVAKKTERVDILAGYAYRKRGNYYAGNNNKGYYNTPSEFADKDYITSMASFWKPGYEVLNTSNQMESWLFKSTFHLSDTQQLEFGYRYSDSIYGEIMPSRIDRLQRGTVQWPLSQVDAKAYNLKYTLKPQDNPWLDMHINVWRTDTESNTYTRGGSPNFVSYNPNTGEGNPIIENNAVAHSDNTQQGITFSNKVNITDSLDLTLNARYQHEQLGSDDEKLEYTGAMFPREGRRQQKELDFDFAWRASDFLELNAGMRYTSFWAFDNYVNAHEGEISTQFTQHYELTYQIENEYTEEEKQDWIDNQLADYQFLVELGIYTPEQYEDIKANVIDTAPTTYTENYSALWEPDTNGNYNRDDNVCLNGALDEQNITSCLVGAVNTQETVTADRKKGNEWVPHLAATVHFNDYNRIYFSYSEDVRYPSLFESTVGFSASSSQYKLNPEHAYSWELAFISDLTTWFSDAQYADIKLAYYHHLTRDVIERDNYFRFENIDKQTINGIELNGRYDSGRFFTDFGLNAMLENQVCDENTASMLSVNSMSLANTDPIPECMKYGFPSSYLLTQATPEFSANWSIGGRFLDNKLELGSRITYYKKYQNKDLDWYSSYAYDPNNIGAGNYVYFTNIPFSWGETVLVDAYANYQVNETMTVELVGTNLTDQYYVDPATRSAMAAPGRTVKLNLTAQF